MAGSHWVPAEDRLPPILKAAVLTGNLDAVKASYSSLTTADSSQHATTLLNIAEYAAYNALVDILEWCFMSGLEIDKSNDTANEGLLHNAMDANSKAVWSVLLANGFDLNAFHSETSGDALTHAVCRGNMDLVSFLLEAGADPNAAWGLPNEGWELGTCALVEDNPSHATEILRLLLKYGWHLENTVTHIAAAQLGDMDALRLLIEHGADKEKDGGWNISDIIADYTTCSGTALYRAAYKGHKTQFRICWRRERTQPSKTVAVVHAYGPLWKEGTTQL